MDLARALANNYVFRDLSPDVINALLHAARIRDYMGGDTLIREFDPNSDLYVILDGLVRVKAFDGSTIAEYGPGCVLGEMALVDEQPRSATAVAVGMTRAGVIPADLLRSLIASDPLSGTILMRNIARVMSRRLRAMNIQRAEAVA